MPALNCRFGRAAINDITEYGGDAAENEAGQLALMDAHVGPEEKFSGSAWLAAKRCGLPICPAHFTRLHRFDYNPSNLGYGVIPCRRTRTRAPLCLFERGPSGLCR